MRDGYPNPILISPSGDCAMLQRESVVAGREKEAWLQKLLFEHPQAIPVAEINDSFAGLLPICRELRTPSGPIDVVYATRGGRIAVLEAKLWRNPEARRKVIGQILDYAKELSRWTYEDLNAAVRAAARRDTGVVSSLFDIVREHHEDLDESGFIDAVTRNLQRGNFLLLIAGDGIRENVKAITDFIEQHGTLHFTFGLVEVAIYRTPDGSRLIQPRVLVQSEIIRRIVVGPDDDELDIEAGSGPAGDDQDNGENFREFWSEMMNTYPLDDSSQDRQPPSMRKNQFYHLPEESQGRISAALAPKTGQQAGVYITFRRGPTSDRLYSRLSDEREAIEAEIGQRLEWRSSEKAQWAHVWREFGPEMLAGRRAEVQAWLGDLVNRFVNAFRPRIEAALKDQA